MTFTDDDVTMQGKDPRKNKDEEKNIFSNILVNDRNEVKLITVKALRKLHIRQQDLWYFFLIIILSPDYF